METEKINDNGSMHADGAKNSIENNTPKLDQEAAPIINIENAKGQQCSDTERERQPQQELPIQPGSDPVAEVIAEIDAAEDVYHIGMLSMKRANRALRDALNEPDPKPLFDSFWFEGELACLVGDTNEGKSILATQLADMIGSDKRIVGCDFELFRKQFQIRYTDQETGELHSFPENFYRAELDPDRFSVDDYEDRILADIRAAVQAVKAEVLIIDNLGYLCSASEKAVDAGALMVRLKQLCRLLRISILVIAHTPKRQKTSPLTVNDLAGSRRLANFFDSIFAIGSVAWDPNLRYIKQLKVRQCAKVYGADNVLVYEIVKVKGFTKFEFRTFSTEKYLLQERNPENEELASRISDLRKQGKSIRSIADELGISKSQVGRMAKDIENDASKATGINEPELPLEGEVTAE